MIQECCPTEAIVEEPVAAKGGETVAEVEADTEVETDTEVEAVTETDAVTAPEADTENDPPSELAITFYSVIVKRAAVACSYPGGTAAFDIVHQPTRSTEQLCALVAMSFDDAIDIFNQLHGSGLRVGEDFGLFDMVQGALVPCHGIQVMPDTDALGLLRPPFALLDESYRYEPHDVEFVWQPPEAQPEPLGQSQPVSSQPRRVVFGTGPVHWLYTDDEDEEECATAVLPRTPDVPLQPVQPPVTHTIRVTYTDGLLASNCVYDHVRGEHSITVDDATFRKIAAGEEASADGQGFLVDGVGAITERWLFNVPVPGAAAFFLDDEEDFDAIDCWFDGVLQPRQPRWYEC